MLCGAKEVFSLQFHSGHVSSERILPPFFFPRDLFAKEGKRVRKAESNNLERFFRPPQNDVKP